jgi:ABC-type branched-subunit amino acid transport system substrate-binding protein/predicted negative regulator of RcsB-dependent stress response
MKKLTLLITFFCIFSFLTLAQKPPKKVRKNYENAMKAFQNNQYSQASDLFKLVYLYKDKTDLTNNALFYQALCEYKMEQWAGALNAFENVVKKVDNPSLINEANYYLIDLNFRFFQNEKALNSIKNFEDKSYQKSLENMKGFYLKRENTNQLKKYLQDFPQDTLIAQIWIDKRAGELKNLNDLEELTKICKQYKQPIPEKRSLEGANYFRKIYHIAVILPFELQKFKKRDSTFVSKISLHLYQGMRLAQKNLDSAKKETKFKIHAYELLKDDEKSLKELIDKLNWKEIDFIIGPFFENQFQKIVEKAEKEKVNCMSLNPIDEKIMTNPYAYSFLPNTQTQINTLIDFAKKTYIPKGVVILYDKLNKNKVFAQKYKDNCEKQGLKIQLFAEIDADNLLNITDILEKINTTETGHIFISTTSQLLAQETLKNIKNKKFDCPIFASDSWFAFQDITFEMYEEQKVHFWITDYTDTDTAEAKKIAIQYNQFAHTSPTSYSFLGYEIFNWVAELLEKNGTKKNYESILSENKEKKGIVTPKIIINEKRNNQFVPIFKFEKGELKEVNF